MAVKVAYGSLNRMGSKWPSYVYTTILDWDRDKGYPRKLNIIGSPELKWIVTADDLKGVLLTELHYTFVFWKAKTEHGSHTLMIRLNSQR